MLSDTLGPARESHFDEDVLLVERFLGGDIAAFDQLYQRHYAKVYALALGVLLRPEEAADATQEVWSLVHRNVGRFDRRARFSTWLYRVAINRSIQYARSNRHQRLEQPIPETNQHPTVEDYHPDPAVTWAMDRLAPDDRAILTLFYWEELSLIEIAESIGTSPNAAKTRLFRAREKFKKLYEEANR